MTIPLTPPGIGSTGVVPSELERWLNRLVQGSEIAQRQQGLQTEKERLKLEQQKHKDAQAQHDQEVAQLAQLGEVARALLLSQEPQTTLPGGSLPGMPQDVNLGATSPFAQLLQGLPAQQVPALLPLLQQVGGLQGQAASTTGQQLQNVERAKGLADDRAIRDILSGLESVPLNANTVARAARAIMAIDPVRGAQVASTLSGLLPGYAMVKNPDGTIAYVPEKPGTGGVLGAPVQPAPGDADQRKAAGFARRSLEAHATMASLENTYAGIGQDADDVLRRSQALGNLPLVGRSLENLFAPDIAKQLSMAGIPMKALREYINARMDLSNAVLRQASGATLTATDILMETTPLVPMRDMANDVVASIQQRRLERAIDFVDIAGVEFKVDRLSPLARRVYQRGRTGQPLFPDTPQTVKRPGETITPRPTPRERF